MVVSRSDSSFLPPQISFTMDDSERSLVDETGQWCITGDYCSVDSLTRRAGMCSNRLVLSDVSWETQPLDLNAAFREVSFTEVLQGELASLLSSPRSSSLPLGLPPACHTPHPHPQPATSRLCYLLSEVSVCVSLETKRLSCVCSRSTFEARVCLQSCHKPCPGS